MAAGEKQKKGIGRRVKGSRSLDSEGGGGRRTGQENAGRPGEGTSWLQAQSSAHIWPAEPPPRQAVQFPSEKPGLEVALPSSPASRSDPDGVREETVGQYRG